MTHALISSVPHIANPLPRMYTHTRARAIGSWLARPAHLAVQRVHLALQGIHLGNLGGQGGQVGVPRLNLRLQLLAVRPGLQAGDRTWEVRGMLGLVFQGPLWRDQSRPEPARYVAHSPAGRTSQPASTRGPAADARRSHGWAAAYQRSSTACCCDASAARHAPARPPTWARNSLSCAISALPWPRLRSIASCRAVPRQQKRQDEVSGQNARLSTECTCCCLDHAPKAA